MFLLCLKNSWEATRAPVISERTHLEEIATHLQKKSRICKIDFFTFSFSFLVRRTTAQPERSGTTEKDTYCEKPVLWQSKVLTTTHWHVAGRTFANAYSLRLFLGLGSSGGSTSSTKNHQKNVVSMENTSFGPFPSRRVVCESLPTFSH